MKKILVYLISAILGFSVQDLIKKTNLSQIEYDPNTMLPIIKCSICNGEQVAGFKDIATGKFKEVMLIRNSADLDFFLQMYGIDKVDKEY